MNDTKDLSIVIPTAFENGEYLQQTLALVRKNTNQTHEIIVVLNGEQPLSKGIAEVYGARTIQLPENQGFSVAMNKGFEEATADCLVGLNDDVLLTKDWDLYLRETLETFHMKHPFPRAGIVGPSSNYVGGQQGVQIPGLTTENLEMVANDFHDQNLENWIPTTFISGFCFMMSREFYRSMIERDGFFYDAETYPIGGAEDNDLCVRAVRAGWTPVIAGSCFVYHFGSVTIRHFKKEVADGVKNLLHMYKKWQVTEPQVLGALYRVKIIDQLQKDDFLESIAQTYKFADRIYILNDQSNKEFWPEEELKEFEDKIRGTIRRDKKELESDDRQELYQLAYEDGCDWVVSIDHDEVFEDKFDWSYAQRLMANPNPQVLGYMFHWYHFWNDREHWRADGNRGEFAGCRMIRCLPNFYIAKRAFHVGNVPKVPHHGKSWTSIRIKHYGQMRADERQRKYEWYEKHDTVKDPTLIGHDDYSHIIDETNAIILPWIEESGVSLTTIMKNEEVYLHKWLNLNWAFMDEIVLVDTGSTDRSVELAEIFGARIVHHTWNDNYSDPRNKGLRACNKEWIFHLDIDEDVHGLGKVRRMIDSPKPDGFMFTIYNIMPSGKSAISETARLFRNNGKWFYTGYVHETADEAINQNKMKIFRAGTYIIHRGFLKEKAGVVKKLKNYLRLNLRQIKDFPQDERGYHNAALHFFEANHREIGLHMLEKAVAINPKYLAPLNELAMFHADESYNLFKYMRTLVSDEHHLTTVIDNCVQQLETVREDREVVDPTHVAEVLQEPEFAEVGKELKRVAEFRGKI